MILKQMIDWDTSNVAYMNQDMNEEIQKLIEQEREIRKRRREIEDKYRQEELRPILQKQIGKCFKYKNSYGSSTDPWWLYERIISLKEDGDFYCEKFQVDCYGKIELSYVDELNYD